MRKSAAAVLATCYALAWAGAASAGTPVKVPLAQGGKTIGGPGDTTISAGTVEALVSQVPSVDACVTLVNTGNGSVELDLLGGVTGTIVIPVRKTSVLCHAGLQDVTIACLATGTGSCSANWRLDSAR